MKKYYTIALLCFFISTIYAQNTPQGMKYQAVARNSDGETLKNKNISIQITLQSDSFYNKTYYSEQHLVASNKFGLFSLEIGSGAAIDGDFEGIPWHTGEIWIEVAMQSENSSSFRTINKSKLLTVPYAFHAMTASKLVPKKQASFAEMSKGLKGVPSQNWSLFGNSKSDSDEDKLGTTDYVDLVLVTDNLDRFRITKDGDITIANSLSVGVNLDVGNDLHVGNDSFLDKNVEMNILGGSTINHGDFTVSNTSSTLLTGTLTVDQETNLNAALYVNNLSPTSLTGSLNVDGATVVNNTLDITNTVNLNTLGGTTTIEGATVVNNTLDITNAVNLNTLGGATTIEGATVVNNTLGITNAVSLNTLGGTTTIEGATIINNTTGLNGQVTINANSTGGENSYNAYPLRVQGSAQGIAIKLIASTPNSSNNFVTFFNSNGSPVGRIEGETSAEHTSSAEFIFEEGILVAEEVKAGVNVGLSAIPVVVGGVIASSGPCGACIAMAAADLVLATANLVAFNAFELTNIGVTYESGSADYAEWLERINPNERINAGDIVSVTGGKISKNTTNARQFMVISTKPAMLGNMPSKGQENRYEKVAFMGQIPVKVKGIVYIGDYIIPSGKNDGIGQAVSPDDIKAVQYSQIVGVAWSSSVMNNGISIINLAIGLNNNDVAKLAVKQDIKITNIANKLQLLEARFNALEKGEVVTAVVTIAPKKKLSKYEIAVNNMPAELSDDVMDEAMQLIEQSYKTKGLNLANHPNLNRLLNDASFRAETVNKTKETYKTTYQSYLQIIKNQL